MSILRIIVIGALLSWLIFFIILNLISRRMKRLFKQEKPLARQGTLVPDPVCGSLVEETMAVVLEKDGRRIYFCSRRCAEIFEGG
jgi:YHS domain-containing protein